MLALSPTRRFLALSSLLIAWPTLSIGAQEAVAEAAEQPAAAEANPSPWRHSLKLGAFVNQTAAHNQETSRDPNIRSSSDAMSYRLSLDGGIDWIQGPNELQQTLRLRYGRVKEELSAWSTNSDEIRYDILGLHVLSEPHFLYVSGRVQTVFEEPAPESGALTPGLAFISAGYGQRYKNIFLPTEDAFQATAGVRAQRRWGSRLSSKEKDVDVGFEARVKYENTIREGLEWRFEMESFAPFDDLGHLTTWSEIGLDVQLTDLIIASMSARAYYETKPKDSTSGSGYDRLSLRQEALIGITWTL